MCHFRRHADALTQGRMRVNRLSDIHRVCTHLDGQRHCTDHVARVGADNAAAQDFAVAVGFRRICGGGTVPPNLHLRGWMEFPWRPCRSPQ